MRDILALSGEFNNIGSYWDRIPENAIDVVACNDRNKVLLIGDVKLQQKNINMASLELKSSKIIHDHQDYAVKFVGFDLTSLDTLLC